MRFNVSQSYRSFGLIAIIVAAVLFVARPALKLSPSSAYAQGAGGSDGQVGKFDLFINSKNRSFHLLVDTANGTVWHADLKQTGEIAGIPIADVAGWRKMQVNPTPQVRVPMPGRFRIVTNFEMARDTFLLDTATGRVYILLEDEEKGNLIFQQITVQGTK
jgi:hypothetical protein